MYIDGIQLERCCVDGASSLISRKLFFAHRSFCSLAEASEHHVIASLIRNRGVDSLDIEIFATLICSAFIRQVQFWLQKPGGNIGCSSTSSFYTNGKTAAAKASVTFIFLVDMVFSFAYTVLQLLYPTESLWLCVWGYLCKCCPDGGSFVTPIAMQNVT
jgi:hypothetical protein